MSETNQRFVALPKKDDGEMLQKYEILVYVAIRYNMNSQTMTAHPSLETIKTRTGLSIPVIRKIIKKIVEKGYMTVEVKQGMGTIYTFSNEKSFEPFSYEFLDKTDLTKEEKLQILCTQQYMFKQDGYGKCAFSNSELAKRTGLNRKTISKNNQSLIEKGYATQVALKTKDPETGLMGKETIYYLNKLGQAVVFALQSHESRLNEHEAEIESLKRDNAIFLREIDELKRQLAEQRKLQSQYEF